LSSVSDAIIVRNPTAGVARLAPLVFALFVPTVGFWGTDHVWVGASFGIATGGVLIRGLMVQVRLGDEIVVRNAYRTTSVAAAEVTRVAPGRVVLLGFGQGYGGCLEMHLQRGRALPLDATIGSGTRASKRAFGGTADRFQAVSTWFRKRGIPIDGTADDTVT
jgi:hypothetical protein